MYRLRVRPPLPRLDIIDVKSGGIFEMGGLVGKEARLVRGIGLEIGMWVEDVGKNNVGRRRR